MGHTPVLLVPGPLRVLLSRFLRRALPQLKVLSHSEIPETKTIRVTSLVGAGKRTGHRPRVGASDER
jgi:flagellar biosynthesis protein FlhA